MNLSEAMVAVGTLAERKGKDELEPFRFKPSQCSRTLVTGKPSRARTHRYSGPFLPYRSKGNHHTYSLYDELPSPPPSSSWNLPPRRWKWGWNKGDRYLHCEGVWSWNLQSAANEGRVEAVDQEIEDEMKTTMSLDELESYYASVSPVISYRAALPAGERDWLEDQFEKIKQEGREGWDGSKRVNVRRVLSLVLWKRE